MLAAASRPPFGVPNGKDVVDDEADLDAAAAQVREPFRAGLHCRTDKIQAEEDVTGMAYGRNVPLGHFAQERGSVLICTNVQARAPVQAHQLERVTAWLLFCPFGLYGPGHALDTRA